MKLLYQQMLAFFGVIAITLAIFGILMVRSTSNTVWDNSFDQLEEYTDVLTQRAVDQNTYMINAQFIQNSEEILAKQHTRFMIYDATNQARYPQMAQGTRPIATKYWRQLKKGTAVALPELTTNPQTGKQQSLVIYYKPVFLSGKLLFVIAAFAPVDNIQSAINKTEHNLLIAFFFSMLAAVVVSYFLARFQVNRINRLRAATHQVAEGDYDVDVAFPTKAHDEVAALANDFQDMVGSLRASQAEIHRQEERRRQFMADAAHEMRTPLTTINGLLEGLAYDAIPEESKGESITLMRNETKRLIRLVNENLDYEKIRTNQIALNKRTFSAATALQGIATQLHQKAESAGDTLTVQAPDTVMVYADHDRFVQVMFNIIQNAIQFTDHGEITITAKAGYHQTELSVSDTGIGMSADQLKNIWERYYKADPSRKNTKYGESGLGLAIVHQLVTLHGGTIDVTSELGQGTTFTLTFPDEATAPSQAPITHTAK
ncbi:sensor histidine kinase [Lacticaseibacillus nasuensis]|uniref:histidine kinase n=1 Tax=Lacticaseibacillus nasuensis JCM 17158 TaxID=1291734 RepID=A0A0R1JS77_9LACO|nr:HAMP domain-containing sensor histidine kinase [Lacticaseibacillus nasuensis]KRK74213.1 two component sensor transduction histidine kinase [Lacticaseibacillus nasuensis JCM 17158]